MRHPFAGLAMLGALISVSCSWLKTPYLLKTLNTGAGDPASPPVRPSPDVRVARLVRTHLADGYFDVETVASWMQKAADDPSPIVEQLDCLQRKRTQPEICYRAFDLAETPPNAEGKTWHLPPVPSQAAADGAAAGAITKGDARATAPKLASAATSAKAPGSSPAQAGGSAVREGGVSPLDAKEPSAQKEIDVERFAANARSIASSISAFQDILGRKLTDVELRSGLRTGIEQAKRYISAREWRRSASRPTTAIVMSGGSATGAFTAGFVSRLLEVLDGCHHAKDEAGKAVDACPGSAVDLVVGTSTGSLVGVLVDLFHTKGQEARARELLVQNYTCSTERDLYCVHNEYDWKLASNLKGLVRFDGIEKKLSEAIALGTAKNQTEFVAVSVDFDSGDIYAQSDQDPTDETDTAGRVQAVLASIVEPVMADPVDGLPRAKGKGKIAGTFIDGGVRSGLPMLEAVHRGAERTLVIATGSVDPPPNAHAASALPILLRTIDLATDQPLVGEVQEAEMSAALRRLVEYKVCKARLGASAKTADAVADAERFCRRTGLFPSTEARIEAASSTFIGPGLFEEVAKTWKSSWVYRPENGGPSAVGYSFDPKLMRELYKQGVRTFQQRCDETLALFSVPASVRNSNDACKLDVAEAVARAERTFRPLDQCHPNDHEPAECK
jgi:predicted acylesterase/phospholipase RssA